MLMICNFSLVYMALLQCDGYFCFFFFVNLREYPLLDRSRFPVVFCLFFFRR